MRKVVILGLLLTMLLAGSAMAFDGQRKGFVLGGGLGFAPHAKWSVDANVPFLGRIKAEEEKSGLGLNLVIGYGWNDFNMIVYEGNVVAYSSDLSDASSGISSDQTFAQGFNGFSWYHYFGDGMKGAFTAVGLGAYIFDPGDFEDNDPGGGILLGGGYQFSPHWQIGGYLTFGKTSDAGADFEHTNISILVGGVAF